MSGAGSKKRSSWNSIDAFQGRVDWCGNPISPEERWERELRARRAVKGFILGVVKFLAVVTLLTVIILAMK